MVVLRKHHVGRAIGVEIAKPRDLESEPHRPQAGRRRDGVIVDVVELELAAVFVAQDHVGGAVMIEVAEARRLESAKIERWRCRYPTAGVLATDGSLRHGREGSRLPAFSL